MVEEPDCGCGETPSKRLPSFFVWAILFEGLLLGIAWVLAWWLGVPLFADFRWEAEGVLLGIFSALPLLALFFWILGSAYPPFVEIRNCVDSLVEEWFGKGSLFSIALLSLAAGVGEEVLFRATLQGGLSVHFSPALGILVASFLFAVCHAMTKAYFVIAFVFGIYFSVVWQVAGNLLAPIVAHAAYDFAALWCLVLRAKRR